jgi:hypothetical protein
VVGGSLWRDFAYSSQRKSVLFVVMILQSVYKFIFKSSGLKYVGAYCVSGLKYHKQN